MNGTKLEEVKIVPFRKAIIWVSVLQSSSFGEESFQVEYSSY